MKIRKVLFSTSGTGIGGNKSAVESLASSILKVIEHENPDRVVFFSTKEADETIELVKRLFREEYNFNPEFEIHHVDPNDFNACFSKMVDIVSAYKGWTMSINYTPGTKTMSAALAAVGALLNIPLIYVSGKREGGIVRRETESIITVRPYKFKDAITLRKIEEMFNANMFDSALIEIEELTEYPKKDTLAEVIKGYALWDSFNHDEAFEIFNKYSSKDVEFIEKFGSNKGFLSQLCKCQNPDKMKLLLVDLISNAERKMMDKKYDDAVARLYRAVELIAQIALAEFGYGDPIELNGDLAEKYREFADDSGKFRLGLAKKMELLRDLGWDLADDVYIKNNRMKNLLESRNKSILAHGFTPVTQNVAEKLLNEVEKFSQKMVKKYKELREMSRFGVMRFEI